MTASYAIPPTVQGTQRLHTHAAEHLSQNQENLSSNGGMNGAFSTNHNHQTSTSGQSHSHIHNQSRQSAEYHIEADDENLDSASGLPPPRFTSIKPGHKRPTSMQRRISVGLPTHLRLDGEGKGYGVPATRKSSFVPSTDPGPK